MGFNKEQLIYIPLFDDLKGKSQVFKNEVLGMSGVQAATVTNWMFGRHGYSSVFAGKFDSNIKERPLSTGVSYVLGDGDIVKTLDLRILESDSGFDLEQMDTTQIVISQLVAEKLGWKGGECLHKDVYQYGGDKWKVVAVIEDFHSSNLKEEILPSVILNEESWSDENLLVRFDSEGHQATINEISEKYEALVEPTF